MGGTHKMTMETPFEKGVEKPETPADELIECAVQTLATEHMATELHPLEKGMGKSGLATDELMEQTANIPSADRMAIERIDESPKDKVTMEIMPPERGLEESDMLAAKRLKIG